MTAWVSTPMYGSATMNPALLPISTPDSAEGSVIIVISTRSTYMKNTAGKWQKVGTTEVI